MILLNACICILLIHLGRAEHRNRMTLFSPIALVGWFGIAYLLVPVLAIELGVHTKWVMFVNEQELFADAQTPFLLFALSALLAHALLKRGHAIPNTPFVRIARARYPYMLLAAAAAAFLLLYATGAVRLGMSVADNVGNEATDNKFLLSFVDLAIPAVALLLFNRERNPRTLEFIAAGTVLVMYALLGSRYRPVSIVLLLLALMLYHGYSMVGPRVLAGSIAAIVAIMFLSVGRTYRQGFDLEAALGSDLLLLVGGLLNESNVHMSMGAVIEYVPRYRPYDFWSPLYVAAAALVPRNLWPNKPTPDYLEAIPAALGDPSLATSGAALPMYGEWYMMGGYMAVFLLGVPVLFLLQREYLRAMRLGRMGLAACITCFCAYSYTRGYLAQNLLAFLFIVLPAYLGYSGYVRKVT